MCRHGSVERRTALLEFYLGQGNLGAVGATPLTLNLDTLGAHARIVDATAIFKARR